MKVGHEVVVLSFQPGNEASIEHWNGVRVHRIPMDNVYWPFGRVEKEHPLTRLLWHTIDIWNWRSAGRVGRILDLEKPDVVHSHVIAGFSVAAWHEVRKRKIRLVHTLHDYYMLCVRSSLFRDGRVCESRCGTCTVMTKVRQAASHHIDEVVSVSQFVLNRHQGSGYFRHVPSSVIFNVMDAASPGSTERIPAASDPVVFGFIGKLEEPKGIEVVLAATRHLQHSDWCLKIAGTGLSQYVAQLKASFPDPRIQWLGFIESPEFYRSIDVAIVPSIWHDPLPYVTIEALFAGKRLICSQSGGIPEIAVLGKTVQLFPAGDAKALAMRMEHAIKTHSTAEEGGFQSTEQKGLFFEETVAHQYLAVYSSQQNRV